MSGFNFDFRLDLASLAAIGDPDPDDRHFAEKIFDLPFEADDLEDSDLPPAPDCCRPARAE